MTALDLGPQSFSGRPDSPAPRGSRRQSRSRLSVVGTAVASLSLALSPVATWAADAGPDAYGALQIIVNADNPVQSVTREEARRVFLKQRASWDSDVRVEPVDQSLQSPIRLVFTRDVLRMERLSDVRAHWQRLMFTGRGSAPPVVSTEDEVIAFVADRPGGVGYVSSSTILPPGVHRLEIEW
jgi:ABC-type phosphate transport system substrate-binding protein